MVLFFLSQELEYKNSPEKKGTAITHVDNKTKGDEQENEGTDEY